MKKLKKLKELSHVQLIKLAEFLNNSTIKDDNYYPESSFEFKKGFNGIFIRGIFYNDAFLTNCLTLEFDIDQSFIYYRDFRSISILNNLLLGFLVENKIEFNPEF